MKVQSRKDSVKVRMKTKEGSGNTSNSSVRDSRLSRDSGLDEQTSPQLLVQSEKRHLLSSSMTNYSSVGTVGRRGTQYCVCVCVCVCVCICACVCVCAACVLCIFYVLYIDTYCVHTYVPVSGTQVEGT